MRELINTKIKEQDEMVKKTAIMKIKDYTSPATLNVWYMFLVGVSVLITVCRN